MLKSTIKLYESAIIVVLIKQGRPNIFTLNSVWWELPFSTPAWYSGLVANSSSVFKATLCFFTAINAIKFPLYVAIIVTTKIQKHERKMRIVGLCDSLPPPREVPNTNMKQQHTSLKVKTNVQILSHVCAMAKSAICAVYYLGQP